MIGAVAEFERSLIRQRQAEGIAVAKAAGKYRGGQKKLSESKREELINAYSNGKSPTQLAKEFRISRASVYNYLKVKNN